MFVVSAPTVKVGVLRHVEGWQAGLVALAIAGLGLLLGAPRAVAPLDVPLPQADGRALRALLAEEMRRADALAGASEEERARDFDLRAVGERLGRYGEADVAHDRDELSRVRTELLATLRLAREKSGDEPLLRLRAYQLRTFLEGLEAWETTGVESADLRRVGGEFVGVAERNGWVAPPRRLLLDRNTRAAFFLRRFGEITTLRSGAFAPSLEQSRALYAFLLAHPPPGGALGAQADHATEASGRWVWTLRKIEELASVDKDYPSDLARGVALYQLGDPRLALASFRKHLAEHPDGPYTLRARNWLAASVALVSLD